MKKWYIKERHNPQLGIYYVAAGEMSKTEARQHEKPGYGMNVMIPYDNEMEYRVALGKFREDGFSVQE